jgi:gentisate 1,2-dioxygenase
MDAITDNDAARRRALKEDLARFNCRVHQADDPPLFTREPRPAMRSVHWRWRDLAPLLDRIGKEVDLAAGGPRRTLRLHNPGLPYGTTPTFWGSIQVILPGEVATAHRHSASALRFIMKGQGAWTTVEGECYPMNEGDLVLTPAGTWHDHVHKGDAPMVWLDVLDVSLMKMLEATFFDPFHDAVQTLSAIPDRSHRLYGSGLMQPPRQRTESAVNPLLTYPAELAKRALQAAAGLPADPCDDVVLEYRNPLDGSQALPTLAMQVQLLRPGFTGRRRRHTGSKLYYAVRGSGTTRVGEERYDWCEGDFFAIAPWAWHAHENLGGSESVLWQVNDLPTLQKLNYFREDIE